MVLTCALATAQTNQVVWLNGKVLYARPITMLDSMTYDMNGMMEGDTLHLIMPRSTMYVVHDTVVKTNTMYVKDTIYINKCNDADDGIGIFSISADKRVTFAKGNLQYTQSTDTWSFAEHQYDYIGYANVTTDGEGNTVLADKIDLFGWGTGNNPAIISTDNADYNTFVDWGIHIDSSNDEPWRTLDVLEWQYLVHFRENAADLRSLGSVNGVHGLIILPDNFVLPDNIIWNSNATDWNINNYDVAEWVKMETAGAVFLPAAGGREGTELYVIQKRGLYWSSSNYGTNMRQCLLFVHDEEYDYLVDSAKDALIFYGLSVRLAKDVK